jgi:regulatory protein
VAATVVDDLAGRGYLDDAAFARQWVEARGARGYGAARLARELRARGVAAPLIRVALSGLAEAPELDRARAAGRRRLPALRRAAPERAAGRLHAFLVRRGYSASVVGRVVRELFDLPVADVD